MSVKTLAKSVGIGNLATGSYTGDGAATQAITGVGFQPKLIIIYVRLSNAFCCPGWKSDQDGAFSYVHDAVSAYRWQLDNIISLDADGFTVGDGTPLALNMCNVADRVYTYVCFG